MGVPVKIGSRDTDKQIFIIAEIGNNHEGSMSLAKQMVREAALAGADAVKFQCIDPNHLSNHVTRRNQLRSICLPWECFSFLAGDARAHGVEFLCTPFNLAAVEFLDPLVPAWKIAARSCRDKELMEAVAATNKPVLQSTTVENWDNNGPLLVSACFGEQGKTWKWLHVVSEYPCPPERANLGRVLGTAEHWDGAPCEPMYGYSDHTIGIDACVGAAFLGARVIEKHFTTGEAWTQDNKYKSNDHDHSAMPNQFKEMVNRIRKAEVLCSSP